MDCFLIHVHGKGNHTDSIWHCRAVCVFMEQINWWIHWLMMVALCDSFLWSVWTGSLGLFHGRDHRTSLLSLFALCYLIFFICHIYASVKFVLIVGRTGNDSTVMCYCQVVDRLWNVLLMYDVCSLRLVTSVTYWMISTLMITVPGHNMSGWLSAFFTAVSLADMLLCIITA